MRFFAQACEVFEGSQPTRQTKNNINCNEPSELKPGQCGPVNAKPNCLTNNDVCFRGMFFIGESAMEEIDNGQDCPGNCHQCKDEKSPARPDIWKCLCDEKIQAAPTDEHEHKGGEAKGFELKLFIHRMNYTPCTVSLYCRKRQRVSERDTH